MPWALKADGLKIQDYVDRARPFLTNLVKTVTFTFQRDAGNGVLETHDYTELQVSDVSRAGLSKLGGDHLRQLNVIDAIENGVHPDVSSIKTLIEGPRIAPDVAARFAAALAGTPAGLSGEEYAALLNGATIDNPVTEPPIVAPPVNIGALIGALSPEGRKGLAGSPNLAGIQADARANDWPALLHWAALLQLDGRITADDAALIGAASAPGPDPSWTAKVSPAALYAGRELTADEAAVIAALVIA